jgi:indole-3-acetate monooxygenase
MQDRTTVLDVTHVVLERARSIGELLRSQSETIERERCLTAPVLAALKDADLFRMFVPTVYNGPEVDPISMFDTIVELARHDAAAAWCVCIAAQTSHVAGSMDTHWAKELFGDRASVAVGAFAPLGAATDVAGGHRVSGDWAWGSGIGAANWVCGGALTTSGEFHIMFFPRAEVDVQDTWYSSGLRGTGSHDFSVRNAMVPSGRSVQTLAAKPQVDAPIARAPLFVLFAAGIAAVMIGIAHRSLEELVALARVKRPTSSKRTIAEQQSAQIDVAAAETTLRAAQVLLREELAGAWETVLHGDRVDTERRVRVRAAAYHVSTTARATVETCCELAGGTAVYSASPLQRCLRDVHAASAHVMVNRRNLEMLGRHRLGQPVDLAML